jgi:3,4-dihydroxy 2-butanone 4-phosphate synthase/GTP cyclohydrolase II
MPTHAPFSPIADVLEDLRAGKMVVLTDDEDRENEGDLILPAQFATPEAITFMLSAARGYLCLSLTEADCDRLDLAPQASVNTSQRGTAFTISIDLHPKHGGTTGVSARERARCIQMAIDPRYGPEDFVRPGHINPLRARDGGVLVRTGQTEGSIDLCRLAGLTPGAIIIEIMRDDGEMARVPDLIPFCARHNLKMCSVAQIIEHRLARESLIKRLEPLSGTPIHTRHGTFNLITFESLVDPLPHVALTVGDIGRLDALGRVIEHDQPTLVRMHRRSLLGDVFGALPGAPAQGQKPPATGHDQLDASMRAIQAAGRGAIVYLRPEGGVGQSAPLGPDSLLESRLQSLRRARADLGADKPDLAHPQGFGAVVPRHMREFGIGGQILRQLGLRRLELLTNHTHDLPGLEAFGLTIDRRVPLPLP